MQSSIPKVLHLWRATVGGPCQTARRLNADRIHVVVGYGAEAVQSAVAAADVQCHLQAEQLGTGTRSNKRSAVAAHEYSIGLFGDVPLITEKALRSVLAKPKPVSRCSRRRYQTRRAMAVWCDRQPMSLLRWWRKGCHA